MLKHVYFFNKSFPESANVQRSLQSIYGIGRFYAAQVCEGKPAWKTRAIAADWWGRRP